MEITFLGHSAFRLRGKDITVMTDPFPDKLGISMGKPRADIVTVSHRSPHHSYTAGVAGDAKIVSGPGEYELLDVLIAGVATASEPSSGPVNTAYVVRLDDLVICHLGDLRTMLTDKQVEEIGSIDILMVPAGGGKALDSNRAAEVVSQLDPALVIPMHYGLDGVSIELEPVDAFCHEMGLKEFVAEPKLTVTRSSLPGSVRVVVLENRRV